MSNTPIEEKFLDRGNVFGLEYQEGLVFFEVVGYEDVSFRPFSELEDLGTDSSLANGFQKLNDSNGDDVLHIDKSDDSHKVIHAGIGMMPSMIRRFTRYPEDGPKLRSIPNLNIPTTSDTFGYVDGRDSPYERPTDAEELVIPPGIHLNFDFYNPDSDAQHEPLLNIKMRIYEVETIDPNGRQDEKTSVAKVVSTGGPAPIYQVGSMDNKDQFNMRNEWDVMPVTREKAQRMVM